MRETEDAEVSVSWWHSICHEPHSNCPGIETACPQPETGY
jgi:hypothetical protein